MEDTVLTPRQQELNLFVPQSYLALDEAGVFCAGPFAVLENIHLRKRIRTPA